MCSITDLFLLVIDDFFLSVKKQKMHHFQEKYEEELFTKVNERRFVSLL